MSVWATGGIIFDQAGKELSQTEISDIGTVICLLFWLWKLNFKFFMPPLPKYSCKLTLLLIGNFRADIAKSLYSV